MKRSILLLLVTLMCYSPLWSQDGKPTKEETIGFINRQLQTTKFDDLVEVHFTGTSFGYTGSSKWNDIKQSWKPIYWKDFLTLNRSQRQESEYYVDMEVTFSKPIPTYINGKMEFTVTDFSLRVPNDKVESFKKAFDHLRNLEKQENMDPFAN